MKMTVALRARRSVLLSLVGGAQRWGGEAGDSKLPLHVRSRAVVHVELKQSPSPRPQAEMAPGLHRLSDFSSTFGVQQVPRGDPGSLCAPT